MLVESGRSTPQDAMRIIRTAAPIALSSFLFISVEAVDVIMAGWISPADLAAVALGQAIFGICLFSVTSYFSAATSRVGSLWGANQLHKLPDAVGTALKHSLGAALLAGLAMNLSLFIFPLFSIAPDVTVISSQYVFWLSLGLPFCYAFVVLTSYLAGVRDNMPSLWCAAGGLLMNIGLNWVFMFGKLGMPAMGGAGAGLASSLTFIAQALAISAYIVYARKRGERWGGLSFRSLKKCAEESRFLLKVGLPAAASGVVEASLFVSASFLAGFLGTYELAAHQIAVNFSTMTFIIGLGVSRTLTSCVAFDLGQGDKLKARQTGFIGIGLSVVWMLFTAGMMILFGDLIASIYTNDASVAGLAAQLLIFAAMFQLSDGLQVSCAGALRGFADTKFTMYTNFCSYIVLGIPISAYMAVSTDLGISGLWIGMIISLSVVAVANFIRYLFISSR